MKGLRTKDRRPREEVSDRKSQCPYEADMWAYEDTVIATQLGASLSLDFWERQDFKTV